MNRLFVYGIFLNGYNRDRYGMSNPRYATVKDYITQGERIVAAVPVDPEHDTALTGLVVDVDPSRWPEIDRIEGGYDRRIVITTDGVATYMYTAKEEHE